jgi:hypothetical protein
MGLKLTAEKLQQELELIGRLLTATKAEVGSLRDEVRGMKDSVYDANRRADKLVDRLIEMSLVNNGQFEQASIRARVSTLDPAMPFDHGRAEEVDNDDETWPPPGCISVDVN